MKQVPNKVLSFFQKLGFSDEEIELFFLLSQKGKQTTLELSRASGISRTQVYRLLENMKKKGTVKELIDEHRVMAEAVGIEQVKRLVAEKASESKQLEDSFSEVKQFFSGIVGQNQAETKVFYYRGVSGFKQMIWNTLRAKKEVLGFTHRELSEFVGVEFMQDWRKAFIRKGLVLKDIYSDEYLKSLEESKHRISYPEKIFISKYMPKKLIDISLQSDIYNDVMSYYNWHEGDIFGVEIYNQKVASLNKQIFMFLWDRAEKAPI